MSLSVCTPQAGSMQLALPEEWHARGHREQEKGSRQVPSVPPHFEVCSLKGLRKDVIPFWVEDGGTSWKRLNFNSPLADRDNLIRYVSWKGPSGKRDAKVTRAEKRGYVWRRLSGSAWRESGVGVGVGQSLATARGRLPRAVNIAELFVLKT